MSWSNLKETLSITRDKGLRLGGCKVSPSVLPTFLEAAKNDGMEIESITFHQDGAYYTVIGKWRHFQVVGDEAVPFYNLLVQKNPKTGEYSLGIQFRVVKAEYDFSGGVNFPTISHALPLE